jgi:hypothetical protein
MTLDGMTRDGIMLGQMMLDATMRRTRPGAILQHAVASCG